MAYIKNDASFSMMENHVNRSGINNEKIGHIRRSKAHAKKVAAGNGDPFITSHGKNAHQQK
eukprot:4690908-Karenia_brevis.AAC.1